MKSDPSGAIGAAAVIVGYWAPAAVALVRHLRSRGSVNLGGILVIDALLAWTVIGWIVAMAMACRTNAPPAAAATPPLPRRQPGANWPPA